MQAIKYFGIANDYTAVMYACPRLRLVEAELTHVIVESLSCIMVFDEGNRSSNIGRSSLKADAVPNAPIESPHSHASLPTEFALEFTDQADLLAMIQFHDLNFALWKQFVGTGSYDLKRFSRLLETIIDWDLFLIIDGCTQGKDPDKVRWFIAEVRKQKETIVDESWLL
jgi:hypothetical protein